jgi:hypothetical protein
MADRTRAAGCSARGSRTVARTASLVCVRRARTGGASAVTARLAVATAVAPTHRDLGARRGPAGSAFASGEESPRIQRDQDPTHTPSARVGECRARSCCGSRPVPPPPPRVLSTCGRRPQPPPFSAESAPRSSLTHPAELATPPLGRWVTFTSAPAGPKPDRAAAAPNTRSGLRPAAPLSRRGPEPQQRVRRRSVPSG